jgi:hypothetical protein
MITVPIDLGAVLIMSNKHVGSSKDLAIFDPVPMFFADENVVYNSAD